MKISKSISRVRAAIPVAAGILMAALSAGCSPKAAAESKDLDMTGRYQEVNTDGKGSVLMCILGGDELFLGSAGLFDAGFSYKGKPEGIKSVDGGIEFDCLMRPAWDEDDTTRVPVHITLTPQPSGLYVMDVTFTGESAGDAAEARGTTLMYKYGREGIVGALPATVGPTVTMPGLLKALSPYMFKPEIVATVEYLDDPAALEDGDSVTLNEGDRYLRYHSDEGGLDMECKYWDTADGGVLLVLFFNIDLTQNLQEQRFIKFDPADGTLRELPTALAPGWPVNDEEGLHGIVYWVDATSSDGIMARKPRPQDDDFDVVRLKFDGTAFK